MEVVIFEEVRFNTSVRAVNTSFDDDYMEIEDVTVEEYTDMYTNANSYEGILFFTTEHFQAAEERLQKDKVSDTETRPTDGMFIHIMSKMNKMIEVLRYAEREN